VIGLLVLDAWRGHLEDRAFISASGTAAALFCIALSRAKRICLVCRMVMCTGCFLFWFSQAVTWPYIPKPTKSVFGPEVTKSWQDR